MSTQTMIYPPPLPEEEVDYMKSYQEALESARIALRHGRMETDEAIKRVRYAGVTT